MSVSTMHKGPLDGLDVEKELQEIEQLKEALLSDFNQTGSYGRESRHARADMASGYAQLVQTQIMLLDRKP